MESRLIRIEEKLDTVLREHTDRLARLETVQRAFVGALVLLIPAVIGLAGQIYGAFK